MDNVIIHGAKKPETCAECLMKNAILITSKLSASCPYSQRIIGPDEFNADSGVIEGCPIEEVEELPEVVGWVPISERHPEEPGLYLVTVKLQETGKDPEYHVDAASFSPYAGEQDGGIWELFTDWYEGQDVYDIFAWFPVPDPYTGREDDEDDNS